MGKVIRTRIQEEKQLSYSILHQNQRVWIRIEAGQFLNVRT